MRNIRTPEGRKLLSLRLSAGIRELKTNKFKLLIIAAYVLIILLLWSKRISILPLSNTSFFFPFLKAIISIIISVFGMLGLFKLLSVIGTPLGCKAIHRDLKRVGLVNSFGSSPILIRKCKEKNNPHIEILEFEANGISRNEWESKKGKLETALNCHIIRVIEGENKRRILLHTICATTSLPDILHWNDKYLSNESFTLVLGESLIGRETVNLAQIPHMLLGGSTGSGKSVLLKLLIMQCIKKNAVVVIADFKGGVDFPTAWHRKCRMCFEESDLLELLTSLVDELERRKSVFRDMGCPNIDQYNKATDRQLQRLIFACDEVAEVLDKNGLTKEKKELVTKIESKLSIIARQGRAFGIHLILATQRPDATILTGQIRNNIDFRVCGRADNVLSQIILDSTDAADQIPKDAQGRFITHNGTVFKGYLFDELKAFEGMQT